MTKNEKQTLKLIMLEIHNARRNLKDFGFDQYDEYEWLLHAERVIDWLIEEDEEKRNVKNV